MHRRHFLHAAPLAAVAMSCGTSRPTGVNQPIDYTAIDAAAARPVLRSELFTAPVTIESVELLRDGNSFLCRVRSTGGAEGLSVSNNYQMIYLYPIQVLRINPFFVGKDARDLDALLEDVYTYRSNYKLQSLALWVPLATVEFAILDMLGKIAGKPIGELISERIHNPVINVYQANNNRGKSAGESLDNIRATVARTGAKAVKFKIAGRMNDPDLPAGRSEKLIPLVREAFGEEMTLYADANGGYQSVDEAVRIGNLLGEYDYDFYEEPLAFDRYADLIAVRESVDVPIAGGEQEPSFHNFRWLIGQGALDIVQPDPFYYGGMIRSMRVARMAAAAGKTCVPHISGSGLGFLYMAHFVSALPNAGPYHEFKEKTDELPYDLLSGPLVMGDGTIRVPTGPGLGVLVDPAYVAKHQLVER